jgi:cytochrome bd-type quinol oxidase subunit 2
VFVPLWILLCLSLVMMLYSLIFCSILIRTPEMNLQQRQNAINSAISNILVLPILVFQILLADKLDNDNGLPYTLIAIPLMVTLFALVLLSFCSKGSCNKFWFGMRKSNFFLNMLGEYGNISITYSRSSQQMNVESGGGDGGSPVVVEEKKFVEKKGVVVPIIPHYTIETPD